MHKSPEITPRIPCNHARQSKGKMAMKLPHSKMTARRHWCGPSKRLTECLTHGQSHSRHTQEALEQLALLATQAWSNALPMAWNTVPHQHRQALREHDRLHPPLRAYQCYVAYVTSGYCAQSARRKHASLFWKIPLMYQGGSDSFIAPRDHNQSGR